jgi:hypothetical protein
MLEVLEFLFKDFWHWLGGFLYLAVIASAFIGFFRIVINRKS